MAETQITTKDITTVDTTTSVDNSDKVFINDNGSVKQVTVQDLMSKAPSGVTEETDPTVSEWAKQPTKPSYTAHEVGALPVGTKIPTKTSDLTNDSGYLTQIPEEYVTETELGQKGYVVEDDIPEKLPSPGTLTFTGAVNDTYDGSVNKTINIPTGGGTGGTTDYNDLSNKPQLNGVTLEGNKTLDQVGVLAKNQGASNSGKFLSVGSDGNVVPADAPSGGTVDPEQIKQAVNDYLEENPPSGMTAEEKEQLDKNTEDISSLSEEIAKLQTSGLTTAQVNALDDMFKKCAFTGNVSAEYTAFKQAFGIESGGGEEEPTDKTLTSISVTYAGGEVTVGTALTDLTGITVTAHYSDGSTDTITGYTLSGEIVEGKNTIIVSYGGKTTTFMVTGVASGGTESNIAYLPVTHAGSEYWAYFPEVVAGDVYYIAYNISEYPVLRDFSPWSSVSASETTWTYEKYNDSYYKITFVTDYGNIGLTNNRSWADLEYSTVKYSKNAVPVE